MSLPVKDSNLIIILEADGGFPTKVVAIAAGATTVVIVVSVIIAVIARKRCTSERKRPYLNTTQAKDTKPPTHAYQNTKIDAVAQPDVEEEDLVDGVPISTQQVNAEDNPYYSNAKRPVTRIRKRNLGQFLHKSDDSYREEFQCLPNGLIKPTKEASKPANAPKNRYKSVYPYDDSRVKVAGTDSDYINACYIDGYKKKKQYIACQGPTKKQIGKDFKMFWKMVWQEKIETIVMVTKLHEVTGMKCDQYWPDKGPASSYAEFTVQCVNEEVFAEFTVRNLNIAKGKETRYINHVNFTAWPDKGVPNDVTSIINLRHKVVKMKKLFDGPLLVHCSAGIGRTGTYIALDILTRQGLAEDHVDIFECVVNMRQQRVNMVQTMEQYKFLHHAVLWTLSADITPVPVDRFADLSWLNDSKLTEMVEQLQLETMYDAPEERRAIEENRSVPFSNRQGADIPGHKHTVILPMDERHRYPSYINAVYVDSYKMPNRFIAAMTPLPDTVTQFLNMIIQEEITCIVDLTPSDSFQDDVGEYLPPDNQDLETESHVFRISDRKSAEGCYVRRDIEVSEKAKSRTSARRIVHHYQFAGWDAASVLPRSAENFVMLVNEVDNIAVKTGASGPIVVHCLSGAERSGLFCAVWLLIERITIDREVSVLNTLRQLKTRRRTAMPNKNQIEFCFECVAAHLRYLDQRVYSNCTLQS